MKLLCIVKRRKINGISWICIRGKVELHRAETHREMFTQTSTVHVTHLLTSSWPVWLVMTSYFVCFPLNCAFSCSQSSDLCQISRPHVGGVSYQNIFQSWRTTSDTFQQSRTAQRGLISFYLSRNWITRIIEAVTALFFIALTAKFSPKNAGFNC